MIVNKKVAITPNQSKQTHFSHVLQKSMRPLKCVLTSIAVYYSFQDNNYNLNKMCVISEITLNKYPFIILHFLIHSQIKQHPDLL